MALSRYVGVLDLAVLTVVAVAVFLPAREMYASNVVEGDEASRFAIALAEARTIAHPDDGRAAEDFARRLGKAKLKDWAIEAAVTASERAKESPTRWRALVAASVAYVDKLEVDAALDYANRALEACETAREKGDAAACPSSEEVRMRLYHQHLDAGVKSGIDPKVDAAGFRRAANAALRQINIGNTRRISTSSEGDSAGSAAAGTPESGSAAGTPESGSAAGTPEPRR